jgi:hypothetical protein
MVAMLPGGFAAVLGLLGLGASSAAVTTLSPHLNSIAQPLLIVSAGLLAVTSLRCSLLAFASAALGGTLLYLGMYVTTQSNGTANPALFYTGLTLFLATYPATYIQRHRRACRPLLNPRRGQQTLAATAVLGATFIAISLATGYGSATASTPSHSSMHPTRASRQHHPPTSGGTMQNMSP